MLKKYVITELDIITGESVDVVNIPHDRLAEVIALADIALDDPTLQYSYFIESKNAEKIAKLLSQLFTLKQNIFYTIEGYEV